MALKDLIFQKGGIGVSMSRQDTIKRLNPLIQAHSRLNHYYNFGIRHLKEPALAEALARHQKTARTDVGKLAESVLSCGGVPYNATELEPEAFTLPQGDDAMLFELLDREQAFHDQLSDESKLDHQIRSQAVINVILANSAARLSVLKDATRRRRRPADAS